MKTNPILSAAVVIATVALISCGGKNPAHEHDTAVSDSVAATPDATAAHHDAEPAFKQQLTAVFERYAVLKDAFVASDASKVKQEATSALGALDNVDMKLVTGAAHHDWMTYLQPMQTALKEISASADIETQRTAFSTLSNELYKAIKAFGLDGQTAYYEYCPMAFDNKGAYWLAKEEKIRNPYFGDKMLTCGAVEEVLN